MQSVRTTFKVKDAWVITADHQKKRCMYTVYSLWSLAGMYCSTYWVKIRLGQGKWQNYYALRYPCPCTYLQCSTVPFQYYVGYMKVRFLISWQPIFKILCLSVLLFQRLAPMTLFAFDWNLWHQSLNMIFQDNFRILTFNLKSHSFQFLHSC